MSYSIHVSYMCIIDAIYPYNVFFFFKVNVDIINTVLKNTVILHDN